MTYDAAALKAVLANAARLAPVERVSLLADQWAQVRAGGPLQPQLDLLDTLGRDSQRTVLETVIAQLATLDDVVVSDADRAKQQAWVRGLLGERAKATGLDPGASEDPDTQLLRPRLVDAMARLGEDTALRADLNGRLMQWLANSAKGSLPNSLIGVALRLSAQRGDAALWTQFQRRMLSSHAPEEHDRFMVALGAFEAPELIDRTLALSLTDDIRSQDLQILMGQLLANPAARRATWSFLTRSWAAIARKAPVFGLRRILGATASLVDEKLRHEVADFFADPGHHVEAGERELKQALEAIDLSLGLRARERENLGTWLSGREGSK